MDEFPGLCRPTTDGGSGSSPRFIRGDVPYQHDVEGRKSDGSSCRNLWEQGSKVFSSVPVNQSHDTSCHG